MNPNGLMVFCEVNNRNGLKNIAFELVTEGKRIAAETKDIVIAVVLTDEEVDISELAGFGADEIVVARRKKDACFPIESDTYTACEIIKKYNPSIVFFGATDYGRVLAPRVAAKLKCGITADCTDFKIDKNGRLIQIRPALGGNILAHIISPSTNPQMASVRPAVFKKEVLDIEKSKAPVITNWNVTFERSVVTQIEKISLEIKESDKIENSKIVVAIGNGIKNREMINKIEEFAKSIGGSLACSRKIVEAGFLPHSRQVGQSGKTISPDIYIAIGISGASQHLAGMKTSSKIIAVNTDPAAEIFLFADMGFVMDAGYWLKEAAEFIKKATYDNV